MIKEGLNIIKVGGTVVEDETSLAGLLMSFSSLKGKKILVHGGGKIATEMAAKLGVETQMIDGRRITSAEMLKVVTMVYGGLVNKNIVARLQALGVNALGLTGADMNVIMSVKRPVELINFGFVGDVKYVNVKALTSLLDAGAVPVLAPLTHDKEGSMLNTNADTMVLKNVEDPTTLIKTIAKEDFDRMVADGTISAGMIPKLQNAFEAINSGVSKVVITSPSNLSGGTTILADPETDD